MAEPLRVVYIDDEPALCRLFVLHARHQGWETETFSDPKLALEYLATHSPDVVLCDYRMPSMTGLELLEKIPGTPPPFVLVTGDHSIDGLQFDKGVRAVVRKPFRYAALAATLSDLLT